MTFDNVKHPSHYCEGRKYEPRKVIHDWDLNFNLGNAVKYISRAGRKGNSQIQDLMKAKQYIDFELEELTITDDVHEITVCCSNCKHMNEYAQCETCIQRCNFEIREDTFK